MLCICFTHMTHTILLRSISDRISVFGSTRWYHWADNGYFKCWMKGYINLDLDLVHGSIRMRVSDLEDRPVSFSPLFAFIDKYYKQRETNTSPLKLDKTSRSLIQNWLTPFLGLLFSNHERRRARSRSDLSSTPGVSHLLYIASLRYIDRWGR